MATKKIARSATTGRVVSPAKAKKNPEGTVTETIEDPLDQFLRRFKVPKKIPKSYGAVADLLYTTRQRRLDLKKKVDELEEFEKLLKNHLIENMAKGDTGAAGRIARAQIVIERVPQVQDWDELYKHIKKTGSFELLNRALNRTAARERFDNGKNIPGVGTFDAVKVSVTKVGK